MQWLKDILEKRGPYGTVPSRQYVPAGQQPLRQRCPGDQHSHAGFPYCHPSQRKHRHAGEELHAEGSRVERIKAKQEELRRKMLRMALRRQEVPGRLRADYQRIQRYLDRLQGRKMRKDGGEAGPLAGADMWVGEDVHVDIPGGDRRNRKRQGIAAAPSVHKAFVSTVQKVLDEAWETLGFVFKNDSYPPETPAPTGGGGGGPTAAPGSLVPANMDVRHTGSPPKGVRWQKLPRQGGESVGGAGAGAVDAARK